ncbi:SDR family NAD(P)-dependent oxidoreductase [Bermanella marisrubri]|uniref:Alcohol dehydrogenase n=1 Tax=Bermanella marisrubri TaxID=207949 RepID=Q1N1P3_9GAMM|nr:SDR family NAD(P)-dependent oxidoreductase [Bermanella marisrubri]EAT12238.1 alcohol dehydrogenase [Oceanobacter sp. RED65] [Bermanella marisrubri]QIZ83706.1 SDR family NAD(P)-dependent oxidoreductase [Bermanella marisrubri]
MTKLTGKVAMVTGAASGIGQSLAIKLASKGCKLALSDLSVDQLQQTVELIQQRSPNTDVKTYALDVADKQAFELHANQVNEDFGQINLLFNNAGVALSSLVSDNKREDFEWLMNINFWGVVNGVESVLPYMKQTESAHIINISSVFGMISISRQSSYNASKFAVRGYTEALAQEMALSHPSIQVSCVHPGGINTNIAKQARISEDEDREELVKSFSKLARTQPEKAADIIIKGVEKNKRRIMVGQDAHLIHFMVRLLGAGYQPLTQWFAKRFDYV